METIDSEIIESAVKMIKDAYDQQWKVIEDKLKELKIEINYENIQDLKEDLKEQGIEIRRVFTKIGDPENCVMVFYNDNYIGRVFDPRIITENTDLRAEIKFEWR